MNTCEIPDLVFTFVGESINLKNIFPLDRIFSFSIFTMCAGVSITFG